MGEQLLTRVKELLHEGNVRRIIIKQEGRSIMEFPLTVGVVGVVAAPVLVAIGAISALIAQCSIEVVRSETPTSSVTEEPPTTLYVGRINLNQARIWNLKGQSLQFCRSDLFYLIASKSSAPHSCITEKLNDIFTC